MDPGPPDREVRHAAGTNQPRIASGSAEPHKTKVGTVTADQAKKIAETKIKDLNARDLDDACRIIAGTAREHWGFKSRDEKIMLRRHRLRQVKESRFRTE